MSNFSDLDLNQNTVVGSGPTVFHGISQENSGQIVEARANLKLNTGPHPVMVTLHGGGMAKFDTANVPGDAGLLLEIADDDQQGSPALRNTLTRSSQYAYPADSRLIWSSLSYSWCFAANTTRFFQVGATRIGRDAARVVGLRAELIWTVTVCNDVRYI